ncbi:MAG: flagellar filament capping protein FliD, partial [bacterium]
MALGSITSLGVGSGFDLQSILDQFREIDEATINLKQKEIEKAQKQVAEYDIIKAKMLSIKSHALSLSLESGFIERSVSSSKEEIVSATAVQGASIGKNTIEVGQLAQKSSFQSDGFASESSVAYGQLIEEILTGHTNTDTDVAISEDQPLEITYDTDDGLQTFSVNLTAGMTLDDVVDAVNNATDNQADDGGNHVTAATFLDEEGNYGIRMTYPAPDKTFSYKLGTEGATIDVQVTSGITLSQLADLINSDTNNPGVTATVINTGSGSEPYRLVLMADESGEDHRITISSQLGTAPLTEANGAGGETLNAKLTVNGISYQRQSNTGITDIIQGVTLDLDGEGLSTIDITGNTDTIKTEIQGMVETFNDLVKEIKVNSAKDEETDEEGLLSSAYSIKSISNEISRLFATIIPTGGSITSLMDLGIEIDLRADVQEDEEGNPVFNGITIDEETLDQALSLNFDLLKNLFLGDSDADITGLGDIINEALRDMTSDTGAVNSIKSSAEIKVENLQKT